MALMTRRGSQAVLAVLLLLLGAGAFVRTVGAYRFSRYAPDHGPVLLEAGEEWKPRWHRDVWAPGTVMEVGVPEDPLWLTLDTIDSMATVRKLVSQALALWSSVETADIRWTLAEADGGGESVTVRIEDYSDVAGAALVVEKYGDRDRASSREIHACHVSVSSVAFARKFDNRPLLQALTHELGHCLGLAHHWPFPNGRFFPSFRVGGRSMWGWDGVMSTGWSDGALDHSERIGASLLRPAPRWLAGTGAIYGTVLKHGLKPDRGRLQLLAARIGPDGKLRDPISRLTNEWGQFTVEGLSPGTHVILIRGSRPDEKVEAPALGIGRDGLIPARETAPFDLVEVRAGERTGPLILTARPWVEEE